MAWIATPVCGQSPWTGGPTGPVYYTGGNVGIGTTTPTNGILDAETTGNATAVYGKSNSTGIYGSSSSGYGVYGVSVNGVGGYFAGTNSGVSLTAMGKVGVGTGSPASLLHLAGGNVLNAPQGDIVLSRYWASATNTRASSMFHYYNSSTQSDMLAFGVAGDWVGVSQNLLTPNSIVLAKMVIGANGNVGIGTTSPKYLLSVNGTIGATDVLVTSTVWSDYVFRAGYRLRPLSEVQAYIEANHHLPEIPSEAEVKEKGVSVGEMQAKLLAKIEELTLHMIRQEGENQRLRERVARLESSTDGDSALAAGR